jgi:O-antigen/teichoic acid export membrane protein
MCRFYMGGLLGLEKQVAASLLNIAYGIARSGLVVLAILYEDSLLLFFGWQAAASVLFLLVNRAALMRQLGTPAGDGRSRWLDVEVLRRTWRFAFGMLLITVVAALNTQLDKLIISKYLPIETLGLYTLAVTLAASMLAIVGPVTTAVAPRFTMLTSAGRRSEVAVLYRTVGNATAALLFPIASVLAFLPYEILYAWTGNAEIADGASAYLAVLGIAYAAIAITTLPYCVAVANGNTRINNVLGLASILFTAPGYYFGVQAFGGIGAAAVFCAAQVLFALVYLFIVDRKYLRLGVRAVLIRQVLWPWAFCSAMGYCASQVFSGPPEGRATAVMIVVGVSAAMIAITAGILLRRSDLAAVCIGDPV